MHSFFSWAPFESILHGPLFAALLRLIARDDELSLRALTCVNEVMAKTFVPAQFGPFLLDIFQQVFALLGNLTKAGSLLGETSPYIEKLIEFTQLFVTHHFARAETSNRFPIMEFLGLLYQFTFMQPRMHGFLECLQIWETLVEFLRGSTAQQRQRYIDGLSSLAQEILRRIQVRNPSADVVVCESVCELTLGAVQRERSATVASFYATYRRDGRGAAHAGGAVGAGLVHRGVRAAPGPADRIVPLAAGENGTSSP